MLVLRIEYSVPDFEEWKQIFDSDPADRKGSGVRRYDILRSIDDPNHVMINLQFEDVGKGKAFLASVQRLWDGSVKAVVQNPRARIAEHVEGKDLLS